MTGLANTSVCEGVLLFRDVNLKKTGLSVLKVGCLLRRRPVTLCSKGAGTVFTSEVHNEYQIGRIC